MRRTFVLLLLLLAAGPAAAQTPRVPPPLTDEQTQLRDHVIANYTKYEYRVPMRDGVKLFTAVYVPKDAAKTYPILLNRSPYSVAPYGVGNYRNALGPSPAFQKDLFVFAYQDVRGRWMSRGQFVNMRPHNPAKGPDDTDESTDTFDTIDWLVKNVKGAAPKVGMWGISYPGFYTAAGMIDAHPALKACSPQAPITDWFVGDDFHHNGCLFLQHGFNFLANFGRPRPEPTAKNPYPPFDHGTPDGYEFFRKLGPLANADRDFFKGDVAFWNEMMAHGTYDEFWKAKNLRPHLKNIKPAVMTVGGWFDAENLFGALECYKNTERLSPENPENVLVMGPWVHGGWSRGPGDSLGHARFGAKTAEYYRENIELPFFRRHLKGEAGAKPPEARVFETGTNVWRAYDAWPPKTAVATQLHLQPGGYLATAKEGDNPVGFEEFVSDPAKPVPFFERTVIGMDYEYMTADQRFAGRRPDVLTYRSVPHADDFTIAGPVEVELLVSTTSTDADWVVKLIDEFPADAPDPDPNPERVRMGGYQMLIRGEPFRGKFRTGFDKPTPFEPGKSATVKFTMPDICHAFRPGHRLVVQVQSSWFPLADRNPQTFCDIYSAKAADFVKATHRVYHDGPAGSKLTVRVVK